MDSSKCGKRKASLNILYCCQLYAPLIYGGGEYIFFEWAKELVKRGHKIYVITQKIKSSDYNEYEEIDGIKIYRVGPPLEYKGKLPPNIKDNIGYIFGGIIRGIKLISKSNIDLIHSNTYSPVFIGQILSFFFRKPHIITFHDVMLTQRNKIWREWANQPDISRFTGFIAPLIERLSLLLPATIIHTVSKTSKKDLSNYIKNIPIVVIPNGILLENYKCNSSVQNDSNSLNSPFALYIGRLVFYKNLQTILRSFDRIIKEKPLAKLIIVGEGPFRFELERDAKHLDGNVIFTGRISHQEKLRLLNASTFLMLPSLVEGFGIVILEAYACKKPVLVSDVMPLPEIVENGVTGFTIPPFNEKMWAEKIIYLLTNTSQSHKMGLKGYEKLTQHYTIKEIVNQFEQLYRFTIKNTIRKS